MDFVTIRVKCNPRSSEQMIPALFFEGFDAFREFDDGFEGGCPHDDFSEIRLKTVLKNFPGVTYTIKEQDKVNWNEEWEKNYDPIVVDGKCLVRASFHPSQKGMEYEIVVNPKMSFGTGHHATTYQLLSRQMALNHKNKRVLDVGTGTGILAVMAGLRGAKEIVATDIDDRCIENSRENFSLNGFESVTLVRGRIDTVKEGSFDVIIANINKNVLLHELQSYASKLNPGGTLLSSGFYSHDVEDLLEEGNRHGLEKTAETTRDNWAMLAWRKPVR